MCLPKVSQNLRYKAEVDIFPVKILLVGITRIEISGKSPPTEFLHKASARNYKCKV